MQARQQALCAVLSGVMRAAGRGRACSGRVWVRAAGASLLGWSHTWPWMNPMSAVPRKSVQWARPGPKSSAKQRSYSWNGPAARALGTPRKRPRCRNQPHHVGRASQSAISTRQEGEVVQAVETEAAATAVRHSGHADRARRSEGRDSSSPGCKHDSRPCARCCLQTGYAACAGYGGRASGVRRA